MDDVHWETVTRLQLMVARALDDTDDVTSAHVVLVL